MQLRVYVIANKINDKRQRILSEKEEYFIMIGGIKLSASYNSKCMYMKRKQHK